MALSRYLVTAAEMISLWFGGGGGYYSNVPSPEVRGEEQFEGQESDSASLPPSFPVSRKPLPPLPGQEGQNGKVTVATTHTPNLGLNPSTTVKCSIPYTHQPLNQGQALPSPPDNEDGEEEEEDEEVVVVALYDFPGTEPHDLRLVKGSEYIILENCDVNWFKARNEYG